MRFRKFSPTEYVMVVKKGRVVREGLGLSVWFNGMDTNIVVVPATAFDGAFAFDDLVTGDYQSVCVQGVTTFMISDYARAARMLDFAYVPGRGTEEKCAAAVKLLESRVNNIIKAIVMREVGRKDVRSAIRSADEMARTVQASLEGDEAVAKLGVGIVATSILGISPRPETRKALEAAAREEILREQDDAIYKRRNAAIEQERIIKENEISTEIAVAEKEKEKEEKEQQMRRYVQQCELDMEAEADERRQAMAMRSMQAEMDLEGGRQERQFALREEAARRQREIDGQDILGKIELERRNRELTELQAANEKIRAEQKAYAFAEIAKAYNALDARLVEACAMAQMKPDALMAKAFASIGENAQKIGTLNFAPDVLESIARGFRAE